MPRRDFPFSTSTRPLTDRGRDTTIPARRGGPGVIETWIQSIPAPRCRRLYRRLCEDSRPPEELPTSSRLQIRRRAMAAGLFLACAEDKGLSPLELHALLEDPRTDSVGAVHELRRRARRATP